MGGLEQYQGISAYLRQDFFPRKWGPWGAAKRVIGLFRLRILSQNVGSLRRSTNRYQIIQVCISFPKSGVLEERYQQISLFTSRLPTQKGGVLEEQHHQISAYLGQDFLPKKWRPRVAPRVIRLFTSRLLSQKVRSLRSSTEGHWPIWVKTSFPKMSLGLLFSSLYPSLRSCLLVFTLDFPSTSCVTEGCHYDRKWGASFQ